MWAHSGRYRKMAERGVVIEHTTMQRYVPEFEKLWTRYARAASATCLPPGWGELLHQNPVSIDADIMASIGFRNVVLFGFKNPAERQAAKAGLHIAQGLPLRDMLMAMPLTCSRSV